MPKHRRFTEVSKSAVTMPIISWPSFALWLRQTKQEETTRNPPKCLRIVLGGLPANALTMTPIIADAPTKPGRATAAKEDYDGDVRPLERADASPRDGSADQPAD
jgi:hypothetical protein